jgi:hypothetical protein
MLYFLYFFIGHLLGDFLFQTSKIVFWKQRSLFGIFAHVFIVHLCISLVFLPYLNNSIIWYAILLNSIFHFFTDWAKIRYEQKVKPKNPITTFWIDQILHVIAFACISFFLPVLDIGFFVDSWFLEYYQQIHFLVYIMGFLFFSYMLDVSYFIHDMGKGIVAPYSRSYYSMIIHTFFFACAFIIVWILARFYFVWF